MFKTKNIAETYNRLPSCMRRHCLIKVSSFKLQASSSFSDHLKDSNIFYLQLFPRTARVVV
jgi:hypothetical protein